MAIAAIIGADIQNIAKIVFCVGACVDVFMLNPLRFVEDGETRFSCFPWARIIAQMTQESQKPRIYFLGVNPYVI